MNNLNRNQGRLILGPVSVGIGYAFAGRLREPRPWIRFQGRRLWWVLLGTLTCQRVIM